MKAFKDIRVWLIAVLTCAAALLAWPARAFAAVSGSVNVSMVSASDPTQAAAGATLVLEGSSIDGEAVSQTAVADANGIVSFTGIPEGNYTLTQVDAGEGYTLPSSPSIGVTVGSQTNTYTGTISFQNTGHDETSEPAEEGQEPVTTFVDEASWSITSFTDQSGTSMGGITASQGDSTATFDGSTSAAQATQTGAQSVSISFGGQSTTVSDNIPAGEAYANVQGFSFTETRAVDASVTILCEPESTVAPEPELPEEVPPADDAGSQEDLVPLQPIAPVEEVTEQSEAEQNAAEEPQEQAEAPEAVEESAEVLQEQEQEQSDSEPAAEPTSETVTPTPVASSQDKFEGTVPALERWIPDPAVRALLAFAGLILGAGVLIAVSRRLEH